MTRPIDRRAAHARALSTVRRISFTLAGAGSLASLGCIEQVPAPGELAEPEPDPADAAADRGTPGEDIAWFEPEPDADIDEVDGGEVDGDLVADALADAIVDEFEPDAEVMAADAEVDAVLWSETTPCAEVPPEDWSACCEAKNWDWTLDPSCGAWGPPMPPRMPSMMLADRAPGAPGIMLA